MNIRTIFEWVIGAIVVSATIGIVINAFLTTDQSGWSAQDVVIFGLLSTIVILGIVMMFARSSGLVNGFAAPVVFAPVLANPALAIAIMWTALVLLTVWRIRVLRARRAHAQLV